MRFGPSDGMGSGGVSVGAPDRGYETRPLARQSHRVIVRPIPSLEETKSVRDETMALDVFGATPAEALCRALEQARAIAFMDREVFAVFA